MKIYDVISITHLEPATDPFAIFQSTPDTNPRSYHELPGKIKIRNKKASAKTQNPEKPRMVRVIFSTVVKIRPQL